MATFSWLIGAVRFDIEEFIRSLFDKSSFENSSFEKVVAGFEKSVVEKSDFENSDFIEFISGEKLASQMVLQSGRLPDILEGKKKDWVWSLSM